MSHHYPNKGRAPKSGSIRLGIKWANGVISKHTFTADQLRWTLTGSAFDISNYWRTTE